MAASNTPKPVSVPTPTPASTPAPTPTPAPANTAAAADAAAAAKLMGLAPTDPENVKPQTPHSSLLGANLEILKGLEKVNFIAGTDGAMTNSAAYLRIWTKKGSAPIGTEGGAVVSPATPNYSELPVPAVANPPKPTATAQPAAKDSSGKGGDLKDSVPSPAVVNAFVAGATQPQTTVLDPAALKNMKGTKAIGKAQGGTVKSANPKGFWNSLFRAGLRAVSVNEDGKVEYQSQLLNPSEYTKKGSGLDPVIDSSYDKGLWQFLFNPEEISVQGNAQYNAAEVWGVMDTDEGSDRKQNSGQPLQWRYNQNEKLVFSKILLNGYVFGRRVNTLEQGLTDLTKLAKSTNPDGPPVLDFVWGQRTFGPCVIRDFNIREKNWDDGVLVNAEISLTLERVPEWVINDGFVDVARPGRQALIDDPTTAVGATSSGEQQGNTDPKNAGDDSPGGGGNSGVGSKGEVPQNTYYAYNVCTKRLPSIHGEAVIRHRLLFLRLGPGGFDNMQRESGIYVRLFNNAEALLGKTFTKFYYQIDEKRKTREKLLPERIMKFITDANTNYKDDLNFKGAEAFRKLLLEAYSALYTFIGKIQGSPYCKNAIATVNKASRVRKELDLRGKKAGSLCEDSVLPLKEGDVWVDPRGNKFVCERSKIDKKLRLSPL